MFVDSFDNGTVDVDDMLGMSCLVFKNCLLHLIVERFSLQDYSKRKKSDFSNAHDAALKSQERFLQGIFPKKTIKFIDDRTDKSSKNVNDKGDGTINLVYDFTDVQLILKRQVKNHGRVDNVLGSEIKIIR
ncbi:MAG: hypothetical protein NTU98_06535 [Bacteroidetes bacterium]|nr:hypothetical protein [Bacteroidota bacterium]